MTENIWYHFLNIPEILSPLHILYCTTICAQGTFMSQLMIVEGCKYHYETCVKQFL